MHDIRLWEDLLAYRRGESPSGHLEHDLAELAGRRLEDRLPFFDLVRPLALGPELRRLEATVLRGARGRGPRLRLLELLEDPAAREAALESLAETYADRPAVWALAVFHPDAEVRRAAVPRAGKKLRWLNLFLLDDPRTQDLVGQHLPEEIPGAAVPAALAWVEQGTLEADQVRERLRLKTALELIDDRPEPPLGPEPPAWLDASLERLLDLQWEAPVRHFWLSLLQHLISHKGRPHRPRVVAAVARVACRRRAWIPEAAWMVALFDPFALPLPWVPGRLALEGLYRYGRQVDPVDARELMAAPLFWRGRQTPDLWALGALMCLASKPYETLRSALSPQQLRKACKAAPAEAVCLLLAPGDTLRFQLLDQLELSSETRAAFLLLEAPERIEEVPHPVRVLQCLQGWTERAEFSLSERRRGGLAARLAPSLAAELVVFLKTDFAQPLALECLAETARAAGPEAFAEAANRLGDKAALALCEAIDRCPGFPYAAESCLVARWRDRPALESWARRRLPVVESAGYPRPAARVRALTPAEQGAVASRLQVPLELCTGLTQALGRRPDPEGPVLRVCLALLGCHDPIEEVAAEFARWGSQEEEFLARLDSEAVKLWLNHPGLPAHGHCWLGRWDKHLLSLGQEIDDRPERLIGLLRRASAPLAECVWQAAGRLLSLWRWRAPARLGTFCTQELAGLLVEALPGPHGPAAATCLLRFHQSNANPELMARLRPEALALAPDLTERTREMLAGWLDTRGLPTATRRRVSGRRGLTQCADRELLVEQAGGEDPDLASAAIFRLIELGWEESLIYVVPSAFHPTLVVETIPLWSDPAALESAGRLAADPRVIPEIRFLVSVGLELADCALEAALDPDPVSWFANEDWDRLVKLGFDALTLARRLAASCQPHAYRRAVEVGLAEGDRETLERFLRAGSDRLVELRRQAAERLRELGSRVGESLVEEPSAPEALVARAMALVAAGQRESEARALLEKLAPDEFETLLPRLLQESENLALCQAALQRVRRSPRRQGLLRRVAESFAWGVVKARELTGRLITVEMHGGQRLGFTRLSESRVFVNPLPMFREEQHGEDVVKGLILHELGHHRYHRDPRSLEVWEEADREGLGALLNLVSDEHLERNLRTLDPEYDRMLKRLGAYAFQHSDKAVPLEVLLRVLGEKAFSVLSEARLKAGRRPGCVVLSGRQAFAALERYRFPFTRFMRALRMGLGNRHDDTLVGRGLALFDKSLREASLDRMLEIARELKAIFGREVELLDWMDEVPAPGELVVAGEGISAEELAAEVERLLRGGTSPGASLLNTSTEERFPPLTSVLKVPFQPELHRQYLSQVARPARRMRAYLEELGLQRVPVPRRVQGYRADRSRLHQALLRGDVRIMVARRLRFQSDLFLGLAVDCSGSMQGDSLHKARLFATLLAEAARGLRGIDVRIFGFTDQELYDAGDADRCSAHSLEAGGGNNDAGALAHLAGLALKSRRRGKLLVMISDGLPTECSVAALKGLVNRLTRRHGICCAQVAVQPLREVCFPHYVELAGEEDLQVTVTRFGGIVARLVAKTIGSG